RRTEGLASPWLRDRGRTSGTRPGYRPLLCPVSPRTGDGPLVAREPAHRDRVGSSDVTSTGAASVSLSPLQTAAAARLQAGTGAARRRFPPAGVLPLRKRLLP